jgi:integrase
MTSNSQNESLLAFIPGDALPPKIFCSKSLTSLANYLASNIPNKGNKWGMFVEETILSILRLLSPFGRITGLAISGDEAFFTGSPHKAPLVCQLANYYTKPGSLENDFLAELRNTLRSKKTVSQFKELMQAPQSQENYTWAIHHYLFRFPVYPLIARDVQRGITKFRFDKGWMIEKEDKLSKHYTGLRRIAPRINVTSFERLLQSNQNDQIKDLLMEIAGTLKNKNNPHRNLEPNTQNSYYRKFCELLDREEWLNSPIQDKRGGGGRHRYTKEVLMNWDDDMPENSQALDGYVKEKFQEVYIQIQDELEPNHRLQKDLTSKERRKQSNRFFNSDEYAIMKNYLDHCKWSNTHPMEMAWFIQQLFQRASEKEISQELLAFCLTVILTGRNARWISSIIIKEEVTKTDTEDIIYQPSSGLIRYLPMLVDSYPTSDLEYEDMFQAVNWVWAIPLPSVLQKQFQLLTKEREDTLFSDNTLGNFKSLLKFLTERFREIHPHAPAFTEGRLRNSFYTTAVLEGKLDIMLASMISGQWRPYTGTPIFYTTVSWPFLAKSYHKALAKIWRFYQEINPHIPKLEFRTDQIYADTYQGSPYMPLLEIQQEIILRLAKNIRTAENEQDLHNQLTMAAVYALSFFCGLRISEVSLMARTQFDFDATWQDLPMPWIIINHAKTSRFTIEARIIPLTKHIIPLLQRAMAAHVDDDYAFHFWIQNELRPVTKSRLDDMRNKFDVKLVRWHGNRQAFHSRGLAHGLSFDCINAILGHQTAGQELFNLFLPDPLPGLWHEYLDFCIFYADLLKWHNIQEKANYGNY